ncbi:MULTISPECIES: type II secretion system F family protein [unclassified Bosea (in: a-proteobacteria)]|uniref:type II secretion system F family protein n=1 Tax=unclassified Bosea (in: a-proteobacteria) TaxID=2653178 RepID=UPI000F7609AF|nr:MULTISPECIES: type II secretion system F family protein [unclassified Bosea (in: a-proteobacteria)]AZO79748.1 type II secretion system protein [Bosea sp. Tri-49]RXT15998.1 type II secretion system protein [Bosea sp. Tri-39]RXT39690.1 type II secretion system protein [Bosea sp. Tri-54]
MLALLIEKLTDIRFLLALVGGVAVAITIMTVAAPLLEGNVLGKRMKSVATERDKIRARERDRLTRQNERVSLRQEPKVFMRDIVERFKLSDWLGTENAKKQLTMAGFRGQQAEVGFLFFRLITPIALFLFALFYLFVINSFGQTFIVRVGIVIGAAYLGIKAPEIYLSNATTKRQHSMRRAFPDALDLMLICVESGMSIELAFRKVSTEIGSQSVPLAEEFSLCTAELSYLSERRQAYENLAIRTGLESVKSVCTALIQAERYGTPLGTALRTLAQESRDQRMNEAEKKAAALPPKLTVPMILFFLPVLFVVIMTPAMIKVFANF